MGIESKSAKVIFIGFALLLLVMGVSFIANLLTFSDVAMGVLLVTASMVLFIETHIFSKLKKGGASIGEIIVVSFILLVFLMGLLALAGFALPSFLASIKDWVLLITAAWIMWEAR